MPVSFRGVLPLLPVVFVLGLSLSPAFAQPPRPGAPVQPAPATSGVVSTQGDIVLGGAVVSLLNRDGEVASDVSDGAGIDTLDLVGARNDRRAGR